ncbi:hypothetical protein LEP1GSC176_1551 [Leptospira kirschneri str. MMD1493]|nr:hypothetical protein [Leptospira kirschneri]EKR06818.1 hypothetical protein LEP1GSC122_1183 [Leptospira kirschneri serovar Valbuzzi str. 200702274]EKR07148.1 hypothetical protein LEP1GSC122_0342 [Leptospira kirschneri serovar Valbuzzi str. 200702274]EMK07865.1 hypothetical protein LEP1GSC176_1551 [Leptospira kirschneri str. MMD1493]
MGSVGIEYNLDWLWLVLSLLLKKRKNAINRRDYCAQAVSIHSPFKEEKEQRLDRSKNYIL